MFHYHLRLCAFAPSVSHFQFPVHAARKNRSFFDEIKKKSGHPEDLRAPGSADVSGAAVRAALFVPRQPHDTLCGQGNSMNVRQPLLVHGNKSTACHRHDRNGEFLGAS